MNNRSVDIAIQDAQAEFAQLEELIRSEGISNKIRYFTFYSLIKACGVIEYSYKTIVADFHDGCSPQLQTYIDKKVRNNSNNPSLDNIRNLLISFDPAWNNSFNNALSSHPYKDRLKSSLSSLNTNRNSFAHGQSCTATFSDIKKYFNDAIEIIKMVDDAVYNMAYSKQKCIAARTAGDRWGSTPRFATKLSITD